MSPIMELSDAITLVILRYLKERDDRTPETTPESMLAHLKSEKSILNNLNSQIQSSDKLATRRPLLNYLLQYIGQLPELDLQQPLHEEVENRIREQLLVFIKDLQSLLKTHQYSKVAVQLNGKEEEIHGLKGLIYGTTLAGSLVQNEIFKKLKLTEHSNEEEIKGTINKLIEGTQNYIKINIQKKDIEVLREEKNLLLGEVSKLKEQQAKSDPKLSTVPQGLLYAPQHLVNNSSLGNKDNPYGGGKANSSGSLPVMKF